ncbi:MAG: hypothetical protein ACRYFS_25250 [Janthinobacterium lividum]
MLQLKPLLLITIPQCPPICPIVLGGGIHRNVWIGVEGDIECKGLCSQQFNNLGRNWLIPQTGERAEEGQSTDTKYKGNNNDKAGIDDPAKPPPDHLGFVSRHNVVQHSFSPDHLATRISALSASTIALSRTQRMKPLLCDMVAL